MDSRQAFEARFYPNGTGVQPMVMVNALFEVWQEGRASMRDEVSNELESSGYFNAVKKVVEKIQP